MEVKLERKDWEQALESAISLLKNALAQTEVYKIQVDLAEKMIKKFPKKEKPLNKGITHN